MAQRVKKPKFDWNQYIDNLAAKQDLERFMSDLAGMTSRDLYEMESYTLKAQYLIDRPVSFAMSDAETPFPIDPVVAMTNALVDGASYLEVRDADTMYLDSDNIVDVTFDYNTAELLTITRQYYTETGYYYTDRWERVTTDPSETTIYTIYAARKDSGLENLVIELQIELPIFPWVAFIWRNQTPFLSKYREALIRLEGLARIIAADNTERRGMALYLEGVRSIDQIKIAPRRLGRAVHMLPAGAKFHSPSPDPSGVELIEMEFANLNDAIDRASGVVSAEKLATLSGISRQIAMQPLLILADEIRDVFVTGLKLIHRTAQMMGGAPELTYKFPPLTVIENKDQYLNLLTVAYEKGAIDEIEFHRGLRRLLEINID